MHITVVVRQEEKEGGIGSLTKTGAHHVQFTKLLISRRRRRRRFGVNFRHCLFNFYATASSENDETVSWRVQDVGKEEMSHGERIDTIGNCAELGHRKNLIRANDAWKQRRRRRRCWSRRRRRRRQSRRGWSNSAPNWSRTRKRGAKSWDWKLSSFHCYYNCSLKQCSVVEYKELFFLVRDFTIIIINEWYRVLYASLSKEKS